MSSTDSKARKGMPLFSGALMYFPDALLAVSEHSRKANEKHNPGEPLHWSKEKSKDHADCIARHLLDIGPKWDAVDPEFGSYHATAMAWRALALLQTVIEAARSSGAAAIEVAQPASADGWREWTGEGKVPSGRPHIRTRNGQEWLPHEVGTYRWEHWNQQDDIVAWKLA